MALLLRKQAASCRRFYSGAAGGGLLNGRVCIITGAGTGVGRALMQRFSKEGATVIGCGRTLSTLEESLGSIEGVSSAESFVTRCDVSKEEEVDALFKEACHRCGRVDVLVNNAAVGYDWSETHPGGMVTRPPQT